MNLLSSEHFSATQKAGLDALFGFTAPAIEGFQKLTELNLQAVKSTLADAHEHIGQVLSVKGPQELAALPASRATPTAEKIQSYNRQAGAIVAQMQAGFTKVAETQYDAHQRAMQALIDSLGQSAPAGSGAAAIALRSTLTAANVLYDTVHHAARQAIEVVEANLSAAAAAAHSAQSIGNQASHAAKK